jgi:hypothetical protein
VLWSVANMCKCFSQTWSNQSQRTCLRKSLEIKGGVLPSQTQSNPVKPIYNLRYAIYASGCKNQMGRCREKNQDIGALPSTFNFQLSTHNFQATAIEDEDEGKILEYPGESDLIRPKN